jgi:hypothetical protein
MLSNVGFAFDDQQTELPFEPTPIDPAAADLRKGHSVISAQHTGKNRRIPAQA